MRRKWSNKKIASKHIRANFCPSHYNTPLSAILILGHSDIDTSKEIVGHLGINMMGKDVPDYRRGYK